MSRMHESIPVPSGDTDVAPAPQLRYPTPRPETEQPYPSVVVVPGLRTRLAGHARTSRLPAMQHEASGLQASGAGAWTLSARTLPRHGEAVGHRTQQSIEPGGSRCRVKPVLLVGMP